MATSACAWPARRFRRRRQPNVIHAVAELVPAVPEIRTPTIVPQADSKATALAVLESLSRGELSVTEAEALLRSLEPA